MAAAGDFVKVKTCIFRVKMHCDGCKKKVKKILRKNEGVYIVDIDSEPGKATVIGNFDPDTLLKQLKKKHKYAEFWDSPTSDVVDSPGNTSNELSNGQGKNNSSKKKKGKNNAGGTSHQVATTPQPQSSKTMLKKDQDKKSSKSNKPNGANLTLGDDEVESEDGEDDDEDSSLIKKNSVSNKSEHAGSSKKNKAKNSKNQQQKVGPKMKNQQPKKTDENIEGFQPMVHGYNQDSATYHPYPYTPMNGHYATYVDQDEGFPACTVM